MIDFLVYGFMECESDKGKECQTGQRYHQGLAVDFPSVKRVFRMFKKCMDKDWNDQQDKWFKSDGYNVERIGC